MDEPIRQSEKRPTSMTQGISPMKEQGHERKQMRIFSPTKGKGHEKKQTSISPEASTSGVFTLPIEVGIEGMEAEFVAELPQKPCVPLEFQTPVDILP
eukprot:CAMPEP_0185747780 /NCGR_PEP_ID=MMETSP1174-20130828/6428_1 /TAXON_ID=35687 /ORGANISM="Dictyocha speculum, Strain CCMP1381" /LENGTH=97 /DNA_ID=CAMNT_0028423119 /DNA_START=18 /DNA_END=307 /DNA_ORIENTATION=-